MAVLSHVAVTVEAGGLGVGGALICSFLDRARAVGSDRTCLATRDVPGGAGDYYERRGWRLETTRCTAEGRSIRLHEIEPWKGHRHQ